MYVDIIKSTHTESISIESVSDACGESVTTTTVCVEDEEEVEVEEFNPYLFMGHLPPYKSVVPVARPAVLPKKTRKLPPISLVLDLDETLVHCNVEPIPDADLVSQYVCALIVCTDSNIFLVVYIK